jgi:hypothetical protein
MMLAGQMMLRTWADRRQIDVAGVRGAIEATR